MSDRDSDACGCEPDTERAGHDPAYRRALWWVVILNLGFGSIELIGGFVSESQSLKADSLDFIGDGSITFVGLLALGWAAATRARIALAQGVFLAILGIAVVAMAVWRALTATPPDAELMGGLGIAGLAVNITAALILAKFRSGGDAQARAIWLYSRNDAINNVAIVAAAGLVYWLESGWPDLIVAGFISVIFLHSAWEIIADARTELRKART
jgi:Co/Zn/Cd efflux system component